MVMGLALMMMGGGFVSDLGDCLLAWIQVHWGKLKEESMKLNLKFIALGNG